MPPILWINDPILRKECAVNEPDQSGKEPVRPQESDCLTFHICGVGPIPRPQT